MYGTYESKSIIFIFLSILLLGDFRDNRGIWEELKKENKLDTNKKIEENKCYEEIYNS